MAVITWPGTRALMPTSFELALTRSFFESRSPYSGYVQRVEAAGSAMWSALLGYSQRGREGEAMRAQQEGFWMRLHSGADTLALHHLERPAPLGTMRGSPTLSAAASQFARSISISTTTGATLRAGDLLGVAGQLVMVTADATSGAGTTMVVPIDPPLRAARAAGTAVVWDRPTVAMRLSMPELRFAFDPGISRAYTVEMVEVL